MSNYKVRVKNEAESKEVQELAVKAGYELDTMFGQHWDDEYKYLALCSDMSAGFANNDMVKNDKELTIQQLRDLVVLKRNCVDDATHTCNGHKYYLTASEFFEYINGYWENVDEYVDDCIFEPIKKEMKMKEYLEKQEDGSYELVLRGECCKEDDIEVPEKWMNFAYKLPDGEIRYSDNIVGTIAQYVIWQRSETENTAQSAWDKQTGGDHYKKLAIQPMEYALKNKLDYAQANVVKYVTRHADKNGKEDLLKAIHNIELMIEYYYGETK